MRKDVTQEVDAIVEAVECSTKEKPWYMSKTLQLNAVLLAGVILEAYTGHQIFDADTQLIIVTLLNMVLRTVTKHKLTK